MTDQFQLGEGNSGPPPRRGNNRETLNREVGSRGRRRFVMPIADHDVFWNPAEGRRGAAGVCFPFAQTGGVAVQKAVPPTSTLPVLIAPGALAL